MDIILDIIQTFDYDILQLIMESCRGDTASKVWTAITSLGNVGALWITCAVALLFFRKTRRAGVAMLAALALGLLIGNVVIKHFVMRPRPFVVHPEVLELVTPGDKWSFPSGHALSAFAAASALFCFHRPGGVLALLTATVIAFSRLVVGVHYPTDVLAGVLIGILCGWIAAHLADRLLDGVHSLRLRKDR